MLKVCQCINSLDVEEKAKLKLEKESRQKSKQIEKELKKSGAVFKQTIKLLLLGTGESGKSTILKQMRIIHISKFSESEKLEKINDIKSNIRDSILSILDAMERLDIKFENTSLLEQREYVYENIDSLFSVHSTSFHPVTSSSPSVEDAQTASLSNNNKNITTTTINNNNNVNNTNNTSKSLHLNKSNSINQKLEKLWDCIEALWKDGGVKKCARRGNEYHLIDSAQYFLDRIHLIRSVQYLPDEQDILRCRVIICVLFYFY